ncbi:MAG: hypothetical protein K8T89_07255 [Planctomycetes bacterium]|nr:hypothetical protein [Planctomycetota bacterium]
MRKWYFLAGLTMLGVIGLVSWATLGSAQTAAEPKKAAAKPIIERVPMQPTVESGSLKIIDLDDPAPIAKPVASPRSTKPEPPPRLKNLWFHPNRRFVPRLLSRRCRRRSRAWASSGSAQRR